MQRMIGQIFRGLALAFLAGLLLQFYLVGAALFGVMSLQSHRMLGFALAGLAIALPVLALIGRLERQRIRISLLLLLLTLVQMALPSLRSAVPWIAALHAVNAVFLIRLAIMIVRPNPESTSLSTVTP
jgi:hypothetical protein